MFAFLSRDRRVAERLRDLASALQAGIPLREALGQALGSTGHAEGEALRDSVATLLGSRLGLSPTEVIVLGAAERSGRLEKALAVLANARNLRAHLLAVLLAQLAYPVFILAFAVAIGFFVTVVFGGSATRLGLWLVTGIVSASVCVWALARAVRRGRLDPARVPLLGAWLTELAEISYLRVLHGLYAAGVPIRTAVAEAARVPPFAIARTRTLLAASLIDEGKSLAESYERSRAVQPETQRLLAAAERAGDLEDALGRVLQRRQESFDARSRRICATLVVAVTGLAFLVAAYVIVSFYRSYFAVLGR